MTNFNNNEFTQKAIDYINSLNEDFEFNCDRFYKIAEEAVDSEPDWDFNEDFAWAYAVVIGDPVFIDNSDDTQKLLYWRYAAREYEDKCIKVSMDLQKAIAYAEKSMHLIDLMTASADKVVH